MGVIESLKQATEKVKEKAKKQVSKVKETTERAIEFVERQTGVNLPGGLSKEEVKKIKEEIRQKGKEAAKEQVRATAEKIPEEVKLQLEKPAIKKKVTEEVKKEIEEEVRKEPVKSKIEQSVKKEILKQAVTSAMEVGKTAAKSYANVEKMIKEYKEKGYDPSKKVFMVTINGKTQKMSLSELEKKVNELKWQAIEGTIKQLEVTVPEAYRTGVEESIQASVKATLSAPETQAFIEKRTQEEIEREKLKKELGFLEKEGVKGIEVSDISKKIQTLGIKAAEKIGFVEEKVGKGVYDITKGAVALWSYDAEKVAPYVGEFAKGIVEAPFETAKFLTFTTASIPTAVEIAKKEPKAFLALGTFGAVKMVKETKEFAEKKPLEFTGMLVGTELIPKVLSLKIKPKTEKIMEGKYLVLAEKEEALGKLTGYGKVIQKYPLKKVEIPFEYEAKVLLYGKKGEAKIGTMFKEGVAGEYRIIDYKVRVPQKGGVRFILGETDYTRFITQEKTIAETKPITLLKTKDITVTTKETKLAGRLLTEEGEGLLIGKERIVSVSKKPKAILSDIIVSEPETITGLKGAEFKVKGVKEIIGKMRLEKGAKLPMDRTMKGKGISDLVSEGEITLLKEKEVTKGTFGKAMAGVQKVISEKVAEVTAKPVKIGVKLLPTPKLAKPKLFVSPVEKLKPETAVKEKVSFTVTPAATVGIEVKEAAKIKKKERVEVITVPSQKVKPTISHKVVPSMALAFKTAVKQAKRTLISPTPSIFRETIKIKPKIPRSFPPRFGTFTKITKVKRKVKRTKRKVEKTFFAFPGISAIHETQVKFHKLSFGVPKQTKRVKKKYAKGLLTEPATFNFPTLELMKKKKKKKRKSKNRRRR